MLSKVAVGLDSLVRVGALIATIVLIDELWVEVFRAEEGSDGLAFLIFFLCIYYLAWSAFIVAVIIRKWRVGRLDDGAFLALLAGAGIARVLAIERLVDELATFDRDSVRLLMVVAIGSVIVSGVAALAPLLRRSDRR